MGRRGARGGRGGRWDVLSALLVLLAAAAAATATAPRYSSRIVHTRAGAVRGLIVDVAARRLEPVEVFLGVPYAGAPQRLAPPPPAAPWSGTRLADSAGPACPHHPPDVTNRTAALQRLPLGAYRELVEAAPRLQPQSEDCLHLNVYVPGSGARGVEAPYAVVVWTGAASLAWGGGALADGAALAARGRLLVVTLNTRLGLLGYLTPGGEDPVTAAGGAAVLDLLAALRWLQAHAAAFGGDPRRVTLVAARAAAGPAGALLALDGARGLLRRVLLLSGSPLAPGALAPDPAALRRHVARALACDPAPPAAQQSPEHWLVACVRSRPLEALRAVPPLLARFLADWAPSPPPLARALHSSDAFLQCELAVVVCTTESYHYFSEDEIRHGFEEEHRNRILRTFVHNVFRWHRNEILAAIRNEYTDWERPIQHPINIRDATLEALSDGGCAGPALRLAQQHAARGAPTRVAHFAHQPRDGPPGSGPPPPPRLGSVSGDAERFFLGLPLLGNASRGDAGAAEAAVALLGAFAKGTLGAEWPRYSLGTQQYAALATRVRTRAHYRGHRLALWLALLPQLHRNDSAAPQHHRLRADTDTNDHLFDGELLPELLPEPSAGEDTGEGEECEPPAPPAARPALPAPPAHSTTVAPAPDDSAAYSGSSVALSLTVCAGLALLALNALVLAVLYARPSPRARRRSRAPPQPEGAPPSPLQSPLSPVMPRKSTLKRSSEPAPAARTKPKRVQIHEISV